MQTQITPRRVIEEETKELDEKPLHCPPSGKRSTKQSVGIQGWAKDPPSLIYPLYLSPPSSYSNKTSRNPVLSSSPNPAINPIASTNPWLLFQCFPTTPNLHLTLSNGVVNLWPNNLSMVWKWKCRRWGNSTNKCVKNCWDNNFKLSSVFARVFSQKLSFPFVDNKGIYIVSVQKGVIR